MQRLFVYVLAATLGASLIISGCAPSAPAPTPTKAPAAPTKAAEPTKAPAAPTKAAEPTKPAAAQPTAAPVKKVDFPQKGKAIQIVVAWPAGGAGDINARLIAPFMEKDLGTPVQVVNRAGGGGQVGITEVALAKPDGYTLSLTTLPITIGLYLDPDRKSVFNRKSFEPVAMTVSDPSVVIVKADSPFQTLKDVIDAAKANPEKIKAGGAAIMSQHHFGFLLMEQMAGVRFALVNFEGTADNLNALLGGHIDVASQTPSEVAPHYKSGAVRVIGVAARQESPFYPGVKTLESQGFKIYSSSDQAYSVPAGTPKEIVEILANSIKKGAESEEVKKKMTDSFKQVMYLGPAEYAARWEAMEGDIKPLIELLKKKK